MNTVHIEWVWQFTRQDFLYNNKGLLFADNVVGVIRKHLAGSDNDHYFEMIKAKVQQFG